MRAVWNSRAGAALRIVLVLLMVTAGAAISGAQQAKAETLELWRRPGGFTHLHIAEADRWLATRTKVVIRDWQISAAAIQVVYFKRRGGNVCYAKSGFNADPALYFHLGTSRGQEQNNLAHYIGARNAARVGQLTAASFKRFHPSAFGIRACTGTARADTRTLSRPKIMRW